MTVERGDPGEAVDDLTGHVADAPAGQVTDGAQARVDDCPDEVVGDVSDGASDVTRVADNALARRAALGDRAAFTVIFHRHGPAMFRYAMHMLGGNTHDAEDALQSAWAKVWVHIGDFRGQAQLRTWLLTLTAREVLSQRRRRRPVLIEDNLLEPHPTDPGLEPEHHLQHEHLREALTLALAELPWRQRAVWTLRAVEGLSYEEIAEVLATTPTVVRGQLHRARTTLAVRMEMWR